MSYFDPNTYTQVHVRCIFCDNFVISWRILILQTVVCWCVHLDQFDVYIMCKWHEK